MRTNAWTKSIDPGQPAQSTQADLGRTLLPLVNLLRIKDLYHLMIQFVG